MGSVAQMSVPINQPTDKVWALFMNPDNLQHWLTGFVSLNPLSGKQGETGSTSLLRLRERGKEIEVIETILALKPGEQYSSRMEHPSFEVRIDIRLLSFGNRTELMQTVQFFPKAYFMKLMMPLMKGAMKKQMGKELLSLKAFMETNQNLETG